MYTLLSNRYTGTMQHYLVILYFLIKRCSLQNFESGTSTPIEQVYKMGIYPITNYQTTQHTYLLYLFLFNRGRFQALLLNSTVFHLLWIPLNSQRAHKWVGAPHTLPHCFAKSSCYGCCPVISCHLGYLLFATLFLGYLDTAVLSAFLSGLVSTFL